MAAKKPRTEMANTQGDTWKNRFREVRLIPIELLVEAEWNTQKQNDKEFNALVENLKEVGLLEPIGVSPLPDGRFRVVKGNHTLQGLRVLEYELVQCTIYDDFTEDMQKFQSVRLNVIHGKQDPEKFIKLYDELAKKYGDDAVADLLKFTDEKGLKALIKDVKAGLSPEMAKKLDEAKKEIKTIDDIGSVLNELFSTHGNTMDRGFIVFSFGGKEHHYVEMDKDLLKRVKYLEELSAAKQASLASIFNNALSEKGVL